MSETLVIAIFTLLGTVIGATFGPVFVARFSKDKHERDAALSEIYLKLADMTADQLQEKFNLVTELDNRVRTLEQENNDLKKVRAERDENIEALQAKLAGMEKQIEKDTKETTALRGMIANLEERYGRMKRINEKLVKALQDANIPLPDLNGDLTDSIKGLRWQK